MSNVIQIPKFDYDVKAFMAFSKKKEGVVERIESDPFECSINLDGKGISLTAVTPIAWTITKPGSVKSIYAEIDDAKYDLSFHWVRSDLAKGDKIIGAPAGYVFLKIDNSSLRFAFSDFGRDLSEWWVDNVEHLLES